MESVSKESDVFHQTDKFDFNKPLKVTCIFEDSDSDGNIVENEIPESIPVQYPSPQNNSRKDLLTTPSTDNYDNAKENTLNKEHESLSPQHNSLKDLLTAPPPIDNFNNAKKNSLNIEHESLSPQHNSLKDLLTAPPIDNYNNAKENTLNKEHERHINGNCNINLQNTHAGPYQPMRNLQPTSRENNTNIENTEASNYNYKTANIKEHFINMLDTISETLITLTKYYHYYNTKYIKDRSVREEYVNRKNEHFLQIYHLSLSFLVPQEHNHAFIRNFILRTIEIAHRKQWHHHMDIKPIETIVKDLIHWTKQKKKYLESSYKDTTPTTMPVQQVPTSNNISYINSRKPMSGTTPISTASLSNGNLYPMNPPPYDSCHAILSPTVPQGSLSTMVVTTNRIAPNAIPAQSAPPVRTSNITINAGPLISQPPVPASNRGFNVQQHMNKESSLASTLTNNSGFNVQQMNESAPVPSIPSLNSRFHTQQQNSVQSLPQVATSNSGFNIQHQMNGTLYSVSAMQPLNSRFYLQPHINGAQSIHSIPTSNSGFNVRHMNHDHSVSGVPTSNSIFHSQQQMNGIPSLLPMATSYNGLNVNHQKIGAPYFKLPVQTSNSGYSVGNGINGAYSVSAVPTFNNGLNISPVATSNTGLIAHQGINNSSAVTSNNSSNGANNSQQQNNGLPRVSTRTKPKSSSCGIKTVVQRSPAVSPTTKNKSASNSSNNVQQQMTGRPMREPQPVPNFPPPASNNANINETTPAEDLNDSIPLFSSGPPGKEISISIDRAVVNKVILEKVREISENPSIKRSKTANDNKNPKKICKETWHPPCNDVQQIIESNRSQTQLNIDNGENMNKTNQLQTSLEASNNKDNVSCEIPFRARSISRDSGFGSPVLPAMQSDNNTVYPNCADNQGLPEITYVTSLNPNASYNNMGLCKICGSLTKKMCLRCYKEYYCGPMCQEIDWPHHHQQCISN